MAPSEPQCHRCHRARTTPLSCALPAGFLYMSEVDAGLKVVDYFGELLREKIPDATARRDLLLGGDKMTAAEAVRRGIVIAAADGGVEDVVAEAFAVAEGLTARGWDGEVLVEIKKAMWPAVWGKVKDHDANAPLRCTRLRSACEL